MAYVDCEGTFKMQPVAWVIQEKQSGSACMEIQCILEEKRDPVTREWVDWRDKHHECIGSIYFYGKGGNLLDQNLAILQQQLGWDGTSEHVAIKPGEPGAMTPPVVIGKIVKDDFEKARYPFKINSIGEAPPGLYRKSESNTADFHARINAKIKGMYKAPPPDEPGSNDTPDGKEVPF